ncbi:hypothetical protein ABPG74_010436 [Tetrahymena malaccensis]
MKTQSNKDSSKTSTASSNASQLDEILDNFFQANKYNASKRPNMQGTQPHLDKFKSKSFEKSDVSSQSQYTQGISKQPNLTSSQKDLKCSERTVAPQNAKQSQNYFDSSSDDENVIEQFKPYSAAFYKQKVTPNPASNTLIHTNNLKNKSNVLCTQSQDSNTPILSDIKSAQSNIGSQADDLHPQQFNSRQNSLLSNPQNCNNLNSFQRQNSLQLNSHNSCELQQSKSSKNNLISSSNCANYQRDSQDKTTVGKDSVEKGCWSDSSKKKGLTYINSFQEKQIKNQNENQKFSTNVQRGSSNHVQSMNQLLNKYRSESQGNMRNDVFQPSSLTTIGDRSNKSSLSKIQEDQTHEDENYQSYQSEYDFHPYEQRLKNSASVSISKNQQIKSQNQSLLQPKNIFNQNQTKHLAINQNESFGFESSNYFNNNNLTQNRQNQINFGTNSQSCNNQFFLDQDKFLSSEKEQFKKYESLYSSQNKQNSNQIEDSNSLFGENQQPKKFSLKKISPIQKFSTQPISNSYLQSKSNTNDNRNQNEDDDDDSDEEIEYLKKIAQNSLNNQKLLLGNSSQQALSKQPGLTLFKSKSTPSPQRSTSLTNILNKFKCNKEHQLQILKQSSINYNNQQKNYSEKSNMSKIFDDDEDSDEFNQPQGQKKAQNKNFNQNNNKKQKQQKKKTNNLNSKRRRLIQEEEDYSDDDDYEYDSVNQFFEEEAKSDGIGEDDYDEEDDFIDNRKNIYKKKKKNEMKDFGDDDDDDYQDDDFDAQDKRQNGNKCKNQLRKKLCLDDYDENDFGDGFQGRKEKSIYLTEAKKKSKEEYKQKANKENKKRVIDSDQSESERVLSSSDKKARSSSRKLQRNKKYDFSESDGAVDENDDYEADSFINDESFENESSEDEDQINLNSPSNEEGEDDNHSNKMFLSIADQKANRKKKKLVKGANLGQIDQFICSVCQDTPQQSFFGEIDCFHRFCFDCILNWSKVANNCPECRQEFHQILKRNFDGTVNNTKPIKVHRKKQKVNEEDYIQEAQALQDQEDMAALGEAAQEEQANQEPSFCYKCFKSDKENLLLICDVCDENYCHTFCDEKINSNRVPTDRWACHFCRY